MAIDFGDNNSTKYITIGDTADLTLPDSDWAVGVWTRVDDNSGSAFQYLLSSGTIFAANSFHLYLHESGIDAGRWQLAVNGDGARRSSSSPGGDGKDRLIVCQRSGGNIQIYFCEAGQTATQEYSDTFSGAMDGNGFDFGRRKDGNTARYYEEHAGELFFLSAALSEDEITALGAGMVITAIKQLDIGYYNPFVTPDSKPVVANNITTKTGSPVQSIHFPASQPVGARVVSFDEAVSGGRVMGGLAWEGGLAGMGGLAGRRGGLCG